MWFQLRCVRNEQENRLLGQTSALQNILVEGGRDEGLGGGGRMRTCDLQLDLKLLDLKNSKKSQKKSCSIFFEKKKIFSEKVS